MQTLRDMLAQNPRDSFARYGLAMEHARAGRLEDAVAEYRELMANDPDYAATYFHAGQALEKLGRTEEAREVYSKGIDVTTRAGNLHARSELQRALELLD